MLNKSKDKNYLFRIHSHQYKDDNNLFFTFTIENIITSELKDRYVMELINDMELLSAFSPQDILTIGYVAARQNMLQEKQWLKKVNFGL